MLPLTLLKLLTTSIVLESAAGGCDFDRRWSYEERPCSGWSLQEGGGNGAHLLFLTGRQVIANNLTGLQLPLLDQSEATETGAIVRVDSHIADFLT